MIRDIGAFAKPYDIFSIFSIALSSANCMLTPRIEAVTLNMIREIKMVFSVIWAQLIANKIADRTRTRESIYRCYQWYEKIARTKCCLWKRFAKHMAFYVSSADVWSLEFFSCNIERHTLKWVTQDLSFSYELFLNYFIYSFSQNRKKFSDCLVCVCVWVCEVVDRKKN